MKIKELQFDVSNFTDEKLPLFSAAPFFFSDAARLFLFLFVEP